MSSLRALMTGLIDYAGLFPPAGLPMNTAVRNYAQYLTDEHAWALGRFIVTVTRLPELAQACAALPAYREMRLSVLGTMGDGAQIQAFNAEYEADGLRVDAVEMKAEFPEQVREAAAALHGFDVYFEVGADASTALFAAIAESGARAKLRTGGVTPEAIPPVESVFGFLEAAARAGTPFKATAGLHHPMRAERPLTYEPGCPRATMHGFVNVFLAAAALHAGKRAEDACGILVEADAGAFAFTEHTAEWRGHVALTTEEIRRARQQFALSFGSCSFEEPIADLKDLGWL